MGTFQERMNFLSEEVGTGFIKARCVVNQPYAQDQHETLHYRHAIGRARYLGDPLLENQADLIERIALKVITNTGSDLKDAMIEVAERLALFVLVNAPVDIGILKTSANPIVEDNGMDIYNRPPISPRERG